MLGTDHAAIVAANSLLTNQPMRGIPVLVGVLSMIALLVAMFPTSGGHGQHADPGPGAMDVWRLRETLAAERDSATDHRMRTDPDTEEIIIWPETDPDATDYIGRHRPPQIDIGRWLPAHITLGPAFPGCGLVAA